MADPLSGVSFVLLEASDGVGGRVRTDEVDGFLLDRGFQIFLTSYPECKVGSPFSHHRAAKFNSSFGRFCKCMYVSHICICMCRPSRSDR